MSWNALILVDQYDEHSAIAFANSTLQSVNALFMCRGGLATKLWTWMWRFIPHHKNQCKNCDPTCGPKCILTHDIILMWTIASAHYFGGMQKNTSF